ncbi:tRNA pseudouridine(38-40) synthase TruA [Stenotrophobium rhamnosiphilum]|uniref:tRNA pseudouridine synthase A n=1 Tax=Stenotrophobium rhamnosiphilum TaxID=2029166 RepID=A0A2T5MEX8_9GAMM|nr:tRNA pseudouridine(38-40) synthase TruA [Stenotrophobium rhamnosiphilum]PTU31117.1 tRNA pseudouridine(38-40) synthase TruA [Stenotrophobium rhamnosiphilum]
MSRWAAGVEYIGTAYSGWQAQKRVHGVQAEIEKSLSKIANHPLRVVCAGRTDTGVHAYQQVIHFDTDSVRTPYAWLLGTNSTLPNDVSLRWVQPVADHFDARYSALVRHYRYVIHTHSARSALLHNRVAWWPQQLDAEAMHEAAQALVGRHDFSAFRGSQCQANTPTRTIRHIRVHRSGEFVIIDICANAFLHHMVRNIAGTLSHVGLGKQPVVWVAEVLAGRDRKKAAVNAPPGGLYFVGPEYPAEFALPEPPRPWFPG